MLSMAPAARRAHGSHGAGKGTRKCAVAIVRHGADGDWAIDSAEEKSAIPPSRKRSRSGMRGRKSKGRIAHTFSKGDSMRRIVLVLFVSLLAPALFAQGTKALDEAWL